MENAIGIDGIRTSHSIFLHLLPLFLHRHCSKQKRKKKKIVHLQGVELLAAYCQCELPLPDALRVIPGEPNLGNTTSLLVIDADFYDAV